MRGLHACLDYGPVATDVKHMPGACPVTEEPMPRLAHTYQNGETISATRVYPPPKPTEIHGVCINYGNFADENTKPSALCWSFPPFRSPARFQRCSAQLFSRPSHCLPSVRAAACSSADRASPAIGITTAVAAGRQQAPGNAEHARQRHAGKISTTLIACPKSRRLPLAE